MRRDRGAENDGDLLRPPPLSARTVTVGWHRLSPPIPLRPIRITQPLSGPGSVQMPVKLFPARGS